MKSYYVVMVNGKEMIRTLSQNEAIEVFKKEAEAEQQQGFPFINNSPKRVREIPVLYEEVA